MIARCALALALLAACGRGEAAPTPAAPKKDKVMAKQPTATLELAPAGDNAWSISAWIANPGSAAIDAQYFAPWVPANISVHDAAGKVLAVTQPTLDTPVQPKALHVEPGARAKITSPITVRFAAGSAPSSDRFVWTIAGPRASVTIACDVTVEGLAPMHAEAHL